ncbi:MAG TPA: alpha-glucosidase, partial [Segetibacter sp.]
VYVYTREGEGKKMLVLLNFTSTNARTNAALNTSKAKILLSNYNVGVQRKGGKPGIELRPYEAVIYQLQ